MADYSNFPFGDFTDKEVFALARESKELDDGEFVKACMDAIRKRLTKREPDSPLAVGMDSESTESASG